MGFLQTLNNDYAMVVSLAISLITMVITLIYVLLTRKQVVAARDSVNAMREQLKLQQQPCVVISNLTSHGSKVLNESGRRQLTVYFDADNVGNSPALSIYFFSHIDLRYLMTEDRQRVFIKMFGLPEHFTHIGVNNKRYAFVHYEEKEIRMLIEDLSIAYQKNIERLKTNPSEYAFPGSTLVLEVYYMNSMNQWFCHKYTSEILWLNPINGPSRESHNINETTIPPNKLTDPTEFHLQFTSEMFSTSEYRTVDYQELEQKIQEYGR